MKVNFSQLLVSLIFIVTVSAVSTAIAQEGVLNETPELSPNYPDPSLLEEKPLLYEPDGKSSFQKEQTLINQSPSIKSKGKNSESTKMGHNKTEEDALSFNFLYYIIQEFKISDIVEQ